MMLGLTIHFGMQSLFQIILHVSSIIYLLYSIFGEWQVSYYWVLISFLGFIPWFIDISLLYWAVFRFRPRGIKKLKEIS